jgi:hypothetical protein
VNVLKGKLGLDFEDIQFIRPEYQLDETDVHHQDEAERGGWGRVKRECVEREKIDEFLQNAIDPEPLVVIQIDTAEAELAGYDVRKPSREDPTYVEALRQRVVDKIDEWLEGHFAGRIRYAITVEETDAWVLAIYASRSPFPARASSSSARSSGEGQDKLVVRARHTLRARREGDRHRSGRGNDGRRGLTSCA